MKYIRLWFSFFSNNLTRDMEFKANFIGGLFVDATFYLTQFFFFSVIFSFADSLGEFNQDAVTIFLVVTFLLDAVYMLFFSGNLFKLNKLIVKGDLDFVLLKPVNSQFFVSFRYVKSFAFFSIAFFIVVLIVLVMRSEFLVQAENVILFLISFSLGSVLFYTIDFVLHSLSFWFRNFSVAGWLSHEMMKFSMRPDSIYSGWLRKTLFTILPMAFLSSVPTRFLLFDPDYILLALQAAVTLAFLLFSIWFWKRGLKLYESASS